MILHIFQKDARRLWLPVLLTWALLGTLARADRWRSDWLAGSLEGWLNLLLPLTWACLIAMAVEQEPLAGDRHFWITRPYRRGVLLVSKLLFVALFIQVPLLLADVYIVSGRGFSPAAHFARLLFRQAILAGALTLPALAVASLVRNFTEFMLCIFGICTLVAVVAGGFPGPPNSWILIDEVRHGLVVLVVAIAGSIVIFLQFARHRVIAARVLGMAAALTAGCIAAYLSASTAYAIRSALSPSRKEMAMRLDPARHRWPRMNPGLDGLTAFHLAVAFEGIPPMSQYTPTLLELEVTAANGERFHTPSRTRYRPHDKVSLDAWYLPDYPDLQAPGWLELRLDRDVLMRLGRQRVKVAGSLAITAFRSRNESWMPVSGSTNVDGVGRCYNEIVEGTRSSPMLKVECESPDDISPYATARLWDPATGREWRLRLGSASSFASGPRGEWLSPITRRQIYFQLAHNPTGSGSQWLVPFESIRNQKVAIAGADLTGNAVVKFAFDDVDLDSFRSRP